MSDKLKTLAEATFNLLGYENTEEFIEYLNDMVVKTCPLGICDGSGKTGNWVDDGNHNVILDGDIPCPCTLDTDGDYNLENK